MPRSPLRTSLHAAGVLLDGLLDLLIPVSYTRLGWWLRRPFWDDAARHVDLSGRVCVVTGASRGLGLAAARRLASQGAQVVLVSRGLPGLESARDAIVDATGNPHVTPVAADLSRLDEVDALAEQLLARWDRLDVLIHNAGVLLNERSETPDGFEVTFAVHVLGPFLLTHRVGARLASSAPARVIFVSSGGMYAQALDVDDLQTRQRPYEGPAVYARAKRAQVALAEAWAARLGGHGVTVSAMHPGWARTQGLSDSLPGFTGLVGRLLRTPDQGADTIAWLASAPGLDGLSGRFWFDRRPRPTALLPGTRVSPVDRARLWAACADLAGITDI